MASIILGYNYDIFISYRQKDNRGERWVSEFVEALKTELESTFKEEVSVYFDINPHDGLLETHDVDASLKEKLKCLVFIPIISRTYCDPKSFAWEHEFKAFVKQASIDQFGLKITLHSANVANRVLPVRIHDLDVTDIKLFESAIGGVLRGIDFTFKSAGVNRPLRSKEDNPQDNLNHTIYRDQINKVALAVKDIIESIKNPVAPGLVKDKEIQTEVPVPQERKIVSEERKHNIPIPTTGFIGREKEMNEIRELFANNRLVTITGAGGCGKTRLASEVALSMLDEYNDGVWFVDLAPISDRNSVVNKFTEVLNIKEVPNQPVIDTLIEKTKNKSLLVLLDNCEHLVQPCAEIANSLLHSVQGIRMMATSREALNVTGEVVWRIPSLSFPDTESIKDIERVGKYEAIKLFVARAALSKPGFTLNPKNVLSVAHICQRVEGIPLAIELAATRIRHMGPEVILARLEDQFKILSSYGKAAPDRQQTLKAAIDWSYDLLSEQEQLLFTRLSVFAGDYSLEAVEEICSDEKLKKEDILSLLSQLVDKSLTIAEIQEDESVRYRCLEPLRLYSLQKLIDSGEDEKIRKKHLDYFLIIARVAYEVQLESQVVEYVNKLEQEHTNLKAALNWSFTQFIEEYIQLSGYMSWFWYMHSHILTGRDYLERIITSKTVRSEGYARALGGLGLMLIFFGDFNKAIDLWDESIGIWRQFNNLWEEAIYLSYTGSIQHSIGDPAGLINSRQSMELSSRIGDPRLLNHCRVSFCGGLVYTKQFSLAVDYVEELLESTLKYDQPYALMSARHFHGDCALGEGDFYEAEKRYGVAVETDLKYGNIYYATNDLHGVAFSVSGQSRWAKAIRLDAAARENYRIIGVTIIGLLSFWDEWIDTYIGGARKKLGEELTRKYEEEGRKMGFEAAIKYALDFDKD